MSFKVIIAGGRDFDDYDRLRKTCAHFLRDKAQVEVVCGNAKGADTLGALFANQCGHTVKYFPADWDQYGKAAGYIRNHEMARYADALIAFWDGESRGTKNMIEEAEKLGLPVRVLTYDNT